MRINLANNIKKGPTPDLVRHLVHIYAQEFGTNKDAVLSHLKSGDPAVGNYWADWLRSQGWQATWYNMPVPGDQYLESEFSEWIPLSFGLHIQDACDRLIAWRLSHT